MHRIFFVTGASGSGKTTLLQLLENTDNAYQILYFDTIGVPSFAEMTEKYGGPEEWQRATTLQWVTLIKENFLLKGSVILDGQIRPQFIQEACQKNNLTNYAIILIDCADEERIRRLVNRGQPELATQDMLNWAAYLREQCKNFDIIDNTFQNKQETLENLFMILNK